VPRQILFLRDVRQEAHGVEMAAERAGRSDHRDALFVEFVDEIGDEGGRLADDGFVRVSYMPTAKASISRTDMPPYVTKPSKRTTSRAL